tara:strand:- start:18058 stop:18255 length:198 start_codon:yes stop_codon:yes gene_type:complete
MRIKAAIYRPDWSPRSLVETSDILQLNAALRLGETWREVPLDAETFDDVPPFDALPVHPDLVEPA